MAVTRRNSTSSAAGLASTLAATIPSTTAGSTLVITIAQFNGSNGATQGTITGITPTGGTASFSEVAAARYWNNSNASGVSAGGQVWIAQNVGAGITGISVTSSVADLDHFTVWELSPCVLDTPMTGAYTIGALTGGSVSCSDAGAILLVDTVVAGGFTGVASPWTAGGTVINGRPSAWRSPGAAGSYGPTYTTVNDTFWQFGLSLKDAFPTLVANVHTEAQVDPWSSTNFGTNATVKTATAALSTQTGDLILVAAGMADAKTGGTWNASDGATTYTTDTSDQTASHCPILLAHYTETAGASRTPQVNRGASQGAVEVGLLALQFRNHGGIGNIATATLGVQTINLTCSDHSSVVVLCLDWNAVSGTRTWATVNGAAPTLTFGYAGDGTTWAAAGAYFADVGMAGTKTLTLTAPAFTAATIAAIEIKANSSVVIPVFGTLGDFDPDLNVKAWF